MLDSQVNDKYKTGVGYHVVPPPYIGNFMPPTPDLILADVDKYVISESVTSVPAVATNEAKTNLQEKGVIHSGCSRNMTGNMSYLSEYKEIDRGYVAFEGDPKRGKITCKGKISTEIKCVVLSPDFKLLDESQVLFRVPKKNNMYRVDLKNVAPSGGLSCLFAEAALDESNLWHRILGHINFKTMNKLVKGNLVRGSGPTWIFDIDTLIKSMNYKPVVRGNQSNGSAGEGKEKDAKDLGNEDNEVLSIEEPRVNQEKDVNVNSTNNINIVSPTANAAGIKDNAVDKNIVYGCVNDPNMPNLEEIDYLDDDEDIGAEADMTNLETNIPDELLQFKLEQVWTLVDLPNGKRANGTKWIYINKKYDRGIVVRNKARLAAQGYTQEEGIDYDHFFAPVARIKEIRLFLAYALFKDFVVYQMYVKSAFLYGKIEEEVYVCPPLGFEDPEFLDRAYKVEKAFYGLHQAFRACQDKYVDEILKKFVKTASTPMETSKPLMTDENVEYVDVHLYRSMIGSLMYLTSLRPDTMFVIIDFLNANPIKYALTMNLTIYTSCIEQFWATVTAKNINGEAQIHAKVDGKKFIISKATIRRNLKFEDEGGGPRRQDTLGDTIAQTRLKLNELIELCTKLSERVLNLETTKSAQAKEISILKKRVKRLERKKKSITYGLKRIYKVSLSARVESSAKEQSLGKEDASKQGRNIADIDADAEITLVDETAKDQGRYDDQEMFDTSVLDDEEEVLLKEAQDVQNVVKKVIEDITTARIEETFSTVAPITTKDVTPDELTMAQALMEINKSKSKGATTTITVTTPTPDSLRPKARGVVMQEPSETPTTTTIPKSSKLKNKSFDKVQKAFDKTMSWINSFVPMDSEVVKDKAVLTQESSSKRAGDKLDQGRFKKQKVKDDKEFEELKRCLEIIPDDGDDVTIDAIPLSIKTLIIDYKIYKEGKKNYF
nr:ribonuclease H-like domain-containing protein [Tanacetum cinerariifolium]